MKLSITSFMLRYGFIQEFKYFPPIFNTALNIFVKHWRIESKLKTSLHFALRFLMNPVNETRYKHFSLFRKRLI